MAATSCLLGMANTDPVMNLTHTVYFALAVAFASATQDIALDAYRIEAVEIEKQGAMAATYQAGYRIAMITAGAGALWIAAAFDPSEATYDFRPWQVAYTVMAALMGVGMLTTLIIREPAHATPLPRIAWNMASAAASIFATSSRALPSERSMRGKR